MDDATEEAAIRESFVQALLDLERSQRILADAINLQNKILSVAVFTGMVLAGAVLYGLYWMETHNFLTKVIAG